MIGRPAVDLPLKAKLFRGLADPSRLVVLDVLRDGAKCVTEIAEATGLSQPNTSLHLSCLQDCGLVKKERRGKFVYYEIAHKEAIAILNQAEAILGKVGDHIFRCTRYDGGKNAKRR